MSYTALYRKFRPARFEDVKGQDHIVTTLKNQIKSGRIGHAYLFCGTRGTGKTSIAKIFAKAVNCGNQEDGSPCGECPLCKAITAGASMNVIEIDAASNNGVDNIRDIVEEVTYSPTEGNYKVYIIDEVHMLSIGAFNALLKTLEEPPSYVIFILATTELHKIPVTILSRCQRYDFKRISVETIVLRLQELITREQIEVEEKALRYIAKSADGAMRDAISLLDQCVAFHLGQKLTYDMVLNALGAVDIEVFGRLFEHITDSNIIGAIELLEELVMQGRELTQFVLDYTWYLRNLLLLQSSENIEEVIDVSTDNLLKLKENSEKVPQDILMRYIRIFSELSNRMRFATQKRIILEMAIIKICRPSMETDTESLLDRIRKLEDKLENGVTVVAADTASPEVRQQPEGPRPSLPQAIPEDIKEIVKKWSVIVSGIAMPMKSYLKGARISLGADNQLLLVLEEGLASDYFIRQPENKERLEQIISDVSHKEVKVTVQVIKNQAFFENQYVDLTKVIHMEIEEDE